MKRFLITFFTLMVVSMFSIIISASAEDSYSGNLIPTMTSATTPSGIVTSSSIYSETPAWKAFDGQKSYWDGSQYRAWGTNSSTGWLAYEFPNPKIISKYVLYYGIHDVSGYTDNGINPKNWTFEGSNNATDWTVLNTQSGITNWVEGVSKEFIFANSTPYKIYRINITANNGQIHTNVNLSVHEFAMMEKIDSVPSIIDLIAVAGIAEVDLTWNTIPGASSYDIKRSLIEGGPYTTIASNIHKATFTDLNVTNGTIYYYVVTGVGTGGNIVDSNEASATPLTSNRSQLVIKFVSGLGKTYDLSAREINDFLNWYNSRASATTSAEKHTIDEMFNKASFISREDNIAFDKIEVFEINEYTLEP